MRPQVLASSRSNFSKQIGRSIRMATGTMVLLCMLNVANAQKLRFDVHTGIDLASFKFSGVSGGPIKFKPDMTAGIGVETPLSTNFALALEVNYSQQGTAVVPADGSDATSYSLDYITIPVLVKLQASPRFSIFAGPQVGILLNATLKHLGDPNADAKEFFNKTDYYAVFGLGYRSATGAFIDARYHQGFEGLAKVDGATDLLNHYFSFRVGYSFAIGK
jgi:hypothetical protein